MIIIDISELFFISLYTQYYMKKSAHPNIPFEFFFWNKLFSILKKHTEIKEIIGACDGLDSWRKHIFPLYKQNRKEIRSKQDIDWEVKFRNYDRLLEYLDKHTKLIMLRHINLESDDIIASLVKLFHKQREIIIYSSDHDLHQLLVYPNVKLISMRSLKEKNIKDPKKELIKLITEGDKTDNIPKPESFLEALKTQIIVDLINLPFIIEKEVSTIYNKKINEIKFKSENTNIYKYKTFIKNYYLIKPGI